MGGVQLPPACLATLALDRPRHLVEATAIAIYSRHPGSLTAHGERRGPPDPRRRPGDRRDPLGSSHGMALRGSVERLLDAFLALALVLLEGLAGGLELLVEHAGHGREQRAIGPPGRLPEPGAPERLGAMEKALLDLDADSEEGLLAARGQRGQDLLVADDRGSPVHAQRLLPPRDQEDEAHVGVL